MPVLIISIQKLPVNATNYFRYFAGGPELQRWGLGLTASGFTLVPPGSPYPPGQHPNDHQFDWSRGRVLDALQIVFVGQGRGWFESRATGQRLVAPGTAFVLLPGVWHRYRPNPETGWTESWIEVQGPQVNRLVRSGTFRENSALRHIEPVTGLEDALTAVHLLARRAGPGFDPELAARAFAVLATWPKAAQMQPARSRIVQAIAAAEQHFAKNLSEPVNVEALAQKLGIAYSHFRREFKAHTGFAPWQYVLHQRLSRARRLLAASDATLDELAVQLGFSSAFHLSSTFKRTFGVAPEHWRKSLARGARPVRPGSGNRAQRDRAG